MASEKRLRNGLYGDKAVGALCEIEICCGHRRCPQHISISHRTTKGLCPPALQTAVAPNTILLCVAALVVVLPTIPIDLDSTRILFWI